MQIIQVLSHIPKMLIPELLPQAYFVIGAIWAYPMLIVLTIGTYRHLIDEFGSFAAVLYSDSRAAESNPGRAILSVVRDAMLISSKEKMVDRICLSKATDVIEYLIVAMARLPVEEVRVLFLDCKNRLIRDEVVSRGSISEAPIYPREILKRALALDASALILAHNHPSGDPSPSDGDIDATSRLLKAAKELGMTVHDHIIVGSEGWVSLRDWVAFP